MTDQEKYEALEEMYASQSRLTAQDVDALAEIYQFKRGAQAPNPHDD